MRVQWVLAMAHRKDGTDSPTADVSAMPDLSEDEKKQLLEVMQRAKVLTIYHTGPSATVFQVDSSRRRESCRQSTSESLKLPWRCRCGVGVGVDQS